MTREDIELIVLKTRIWMENQSPAYFRMEAKKLQLKGDFDMANVLFVWARWRDSA